MHVLFGRLVFSDTWSTYRTTQLNNRSPPLGGGPIKDKRFYYTHSQMCAHTYAPGCVLRKRNTWQSIFQRTLTQRAFHRLAAIARSRCLRASHLFLFCSLFSPYRTRTRTRTRSIPSTGFVEVNLQIIKLKHVLYFAISAFFRNRHGIDYEKGRCFLQV